MRPGLGTSSATRDLQEPPSPGLEGDFGGRRSRAILDRTFYHTRWGLKAGVAPLKHFLEGRSCRQARGALSHQCSLQPLQQLSLSESIKSISKGEAPTEAEWRGCSPSPRHPSRPNMLFSQMPPQIKPVRTVPQTRNRNPQIYLAP